MSRVTLRVRFCGELNDFLKPARRDREFEYGAGASDTVKHIIESLGVPHPEIGRIEVNGQTVSWSSQTADGDAIAVFPHATPIILTDRRFVLDGHLGRLAAYMRMLGFDCWYERFADDDMLATIASKEARVLLTRDVGLLKRREIERAYCVRHDLPHDQLREVSRRFALHPHFRPFQRCMDCNGQLRAVSKDEVIDHLPPHTRETKNDFSRCLNCGKVYWRGSHHARMLEWIEELEKQPNIS